MGRLVSPAEALARIPQREPFRFVDELLELDGEHAIGTYRWRPEADFYRGHFPGNPVTPGVLMIECMAQCAVVPIAIYLFFRDHDEASAEKFTTLFTDASVDFTGMVRPGDRVRVTSQVLFYRRRKVRVKAEMALDDGSVVCSGELAGIGVVS